jgi:hypothetical protein
MTGLPPHTKRLRTDPMDDTAITNIVATTAAAHHPAVTEKGGSSAQ